MRLKHLRHRMTFYGYGHGCTSLVVERTNNIKKETELPDTAIENTLTTSLRGVKKNIYKGCELISVPSDQLAKFPLCVEPIVNDPVCILPPSGLSTSHRNKLRKVRPSSANVAYDRKDTKYAIVPSWPQSAHFNKKSSEENSAVKQMEPHVYGYVSKKYISNNDTDLSNCKSDIHPYKMCEVGIKRIENSNEDDSPAIPSSLRPLQPWLLKAPQITNSLGMDLSNCLVFLSPDALSQPLPTVPSPQSAMDPLPSYGSVSNTPEVITNRNFSRSKLRKPVNAWQCNDRSKLKKVSSEIEIYSKEETLIHRRYAGHRDAKIVREEIAELEKLMKGIGSHDGISIVVRYQAEIKELQDSLQETKPYIDQIKSYRTLRINGQQDETIPLDHFGLREFYEEHDKVMAIIVQEYKACLKELQQIEDGLGIDSARKHFKQRYQQIASQE